MLPQTQKLRDRVTAALRAAIISGELTPGTIYSAPELARAFGVSPTPVREAMISLVNDALVEKLPNRGFRVIELDPAILDQAVEARLLLEVPTMGAIAQACTGDVAKAVFALLPLVDAMETTARHGDLVRLLETDTTFHTRFLSLHGNNVIVDTVRNMRSLARLTGLKALAERGKLLETTGDHRAMVTAALDRDRPAMERLVTAHINNVRSTWS
ncbi:GntR family transcriptional regulator [Corynebacterium lizhenjunii]|uniref:GntR family transcriptional regulator n=1 Tax=Corynebacterium lizhenjunii TaxID=2709394 RepID=UPI001F1B370C|nr:GntR family transcriptional regulator [Corynebacterium lizhenjunii]